MPERLFDALARVFGLLVVGQIGSQHGGPRRVVAELRPFVARRPGRFNHHAAVVAKLGQKFGHRLDGFVINLDGQLQPCHRISDFRLWIVDFRQESKRDAVKRLVILSEAKNLDHNPSLCSG